MNSHRSRVGLLAHIPCAPQTSWHQLLQPSERQARRSPCMSPALMRQPTHSVERLTTTSSFQQRVLAPQSHNKLKPWTPHPHSAQLLSPSTQRWSHPWPPNPQQERLSKVRLPPPVMIFLLFHNLLLLVFSRCEHILFGMCRYNYVSLLLVVHPFHSRLFIL